MLYLSQQRHLAWKSCNTIRHGLRFFYQITLDRPVTQFYLPCAKEPSKLPQILSHEELVRLFTVATNPKHRALLMTTYAAGLRATEVTRLRLTDIDSARMSIRVEQGKGRKDRYAMLAPTLLTLLRAWWCEARARGKMLPNGWLFPGQNPVNPMSTRQLNRACHAAAQAGGIDKRVSLHTLRHYVFSWTM